MTEEKELQPVDISGKLKRSAAGVTSAGVIVVAPLVGTMALMANEVYDYAPGRLRGVKLEEVLFGTFDFTGGDFCRSDTVR